MQENNSPKAQAVVKKNEIYVSVKRKKSTICKGYFKKNM